jgi:hypothetical protein
MDGSELFRLFVGYIFAIAGQTLFLIGLEASILPIGKLVGGSLVKLKKTVFIVLFGFVFGLLATVAEPAVSVLSAQVHMVEGLVDKTLLIWVLGFGIGGAVSLALFRVIKDINIKLIFGIFYVLIFILAFVVPNSFLALAFDGSGSTTGLVSSPFILTLGLGVSMTMSRTKTNDESFGVIGIASLGPILAVFIYGMLLGEPQSAASGFSAGGVQSFWDIAAENFLDVAMAIIPVIAVFFIFQLIFIKLPKRRLFRILLASGVVYIGLHIFLTGVNFGFLLAGEHIGMAFMSESAPWLKWLLLPLGFILGFAITLSEPSVTVLGGQVEIITNGHIKKNTIRIALAVGIGVAAMLALAKILIDDGSERFILWFLIPLYAAALIIMIFTPKLFVGLAFDSGGVGSGAMISAFLTPMTLGISTYLGQDALSSGFGMIAFIAVMPIITIETLGLVYSVKLKKLHTRETERRVFDDELNQLNALSLDAEGARPRQAETASKN